MMTLTQLKVQLTSHLNEMASRNSYEVRDKALALLDLAYNLGLSDADKNYQAAVITSTPKRNVPSHD